MKKRSVRSLFILCLLLFACSLFIAKPVAAKMKLNKKTVYLAPKQTCKLKVKGTKKHVTWKSANKKIAVVSGKGKVTAKKKGTAVIVAKVGKKKLKCKVIVDKKERNNARKLRDFILKKGTKGSDGYYIEYVVFDEENSAYTTRITATKGEKPFSFYCSMEPDAGSLASYRYDMRINLIKGTAGIAEYNLFEHSDGTGYRSKAKISTDFDGKGKGLKMIECADIDQEGGETLHTDEAYLAERNLSGSVAGTFKYYDKLLKKKKTGLTMKSIGFKNYK